MKKQKKPFKDKITVSGSSEEKDISAKLFDIRGNEILPAGNFGHEYHSIGEYLKSGIYFLHVSTDRGNYTRRIVKSE